MVPKTRFCGLHFCHSLADNVVLTLTILMLLDGPKGTKFGDIMESNGQLRRSRCALSGSIKSQYATS